MTLFDLAQRYVGIRELSGVKNHPLVSWWLSLCGYGLDAADDIPWCSAFVNGIAWELRLPRSKSAAARSWLDVGIPVEIEQAHPGRNDIVILKRGPAPQGHVGIFAGRSPGGDVFVLGGNQGDAVTVQQFAASDILGVRRLRGA